MCGDAGVVIAVSESRCLSVRLKIGDSCSLLLLLLLSLLLLLVVVVVMVCI